MIPELLVDSDEFWARLRADIAVARERVYVQTMSFEGDATGRMLTDALLASAARDRRLLVDAYSKVVVNDRFLYGPRALLDRPLRREARETLRLMERLREDGVGARFTCPLGPLLVRLPCRNHKKLVVVDDALYLGGINFCDHNFAWRDLMVRIAAPEPADLAASDFRSTWAGRNAHAAERFDGLELHFLDGVTNARAFAPILRHFRRARESIVVISPYLTWPFIEPLHEARRRGVHVTILGAALNNHPKVGHYIAWQARRCGFELRLYPDRMNHMKAALIDDETLIVGSSNFDVISHAAHHEVVAICDAPALVEDFRRRVLEPDLAASVPYDGPVSGVGGWLTEWSFRSLAGLLAATRPRPRAGPRAPARPRVRATAGPGAPVRAGEASEERPAPRP